MYRYDSMLNAQSASTWKLALEIVHGIRFREKQKPESFTKRIHSWKR